MIRVLLDNVWVLPGQKKSSGLKDIPFLMNLVLHTSYLPSPFPPFLYLAHQEYSHPPNTTTQTPAQPFRPYTTLSHHHQHQTHHELIIIAHLNSKPNQEKDGKKYLLPYYMHNIQISANRWSFMLSLEHGSHPSLGNTLPRCV